MALFPRDRKTTVKYVHIWEKAHTNALLGSSLLTNIQGQNIVMTRLQEQREGHLHVRDETNTMPHNCDQAIAANFRKATIVHIF